MNCEVPSFPVVLQRRFHGVVYSILHFPLSTLWREFRPRRRVLWPFEMHMTILGRRHFLFKWKPALIVSVLVPTCAFWTSFGFQGRLSTLFQHMGHLSVCLCHQGVGCSLTAFGLWQSRGYLDLDLRCGRAVSLIWETFSLSKRSKMCGPPVDHLSMFDDGPLAPVSLSDH